MVGKEVLLKQLVNVCLNDESFTAFLLPMKDWKFLSFVAQDILTTKQSHNWFAMAVWSYFFLPSFNKKMFKS